MKDLPCVFTGLFDIVKISHFLNSSPKNPNRYNFLIGIETLKPKHINKCKKAKIAELTLNSKTNTN